MNQIDIDLCINSAEFGYNGKARGWDFEKTKEELLKMLVRI